MRWLDVPYQRERHDGWCLPACVAMVTAYAGHPLSQHDVARWLGTRFIGTPASRIQWLAQRGWQVEYSTGSVENLEEWLQQSCPVILFVRTGDLRPHWIRDTPHAVVLAGLDAERAALFDPGLELNQPIMVAIGDLLLAWSPFDYTYAVMRPASARKKH